MRNKVQAMFTGRKNIFQEKYGVLFLYLLVLSISSVIYFVLKGKLSESESRLVMSDSLGSMDYTGHGIFQARTLENSLLQEIFPTQGLNLGLLHCRQIPYQLSHKGSPRTLEWVAYPFSIGSSQPRNRTRVSCIAGGFFTS